MGDALVPVHFRRNQGRVYASQQVLRIFAPHGSRYLRHLRADDSVDGARRHDTSHVLIEGGTRRIDVSEGALPARRKLFNGRVARCEHGGERLCAAAHCGTGSAKVDQVGSPAASTMMLAGLNSAYSDYLKGNRCDRCSDYLHQQNSWGRLLFWDYAPRHGHSEVDPPTGDYLD